MKTRTVFFRGEKRRNKVGRANDTFLLDAIPTLEYNP
jgi:hypothetical protein